MSGYFIPPETKFFFGVDIGRDHDPSVIALVERIQLTHIAGQNVSREYKYVLTFLHTIPLGTSYPQVIQRFQDALRRLLINASKAYPDVVVDATGVGAPLIDDFKKLRSQCFTIPVIITGGEALHERKDGTHCIPRHELLMAVHMLVEKGLFQIASDLPNSEALFREMLNLKHDGSQHSETLHDDRIMAVALAVHRAQRYTS